MTETIAQQLIRSQGGTPLPPPPPEPPLLVVSVVDYQRVRRACPPKCLPINDLWKLCTDTAPTCDLYFIALFYYIARE